MSAFREGLPDYYHYRWSSAKDESAVQAALKLLDSTKDSILAQSINQYSSALQNFYSGLSGLELTDEQSAIIDFAADETLTAQDLNAQLSQALVTSPVSGTDYGGGQQLVAAVQNLRREAQKSNRKMINLSDLMDSFAKTDLYTQVEDAILGEGGNLKSQRSRSIVVKRVVRNILASPDGTEWEQNMKGRKIDGIGNKVNQWLILLYALTNNQAPRGSKTAVKTIILNAVRDSLSSLTGALGEVGGLTASIAGTAQYYETLNKHMKDMKNDLEKKSKVTGGNGLSYSVKVKNDEYTSAILNNLKNQLLALNGKQFTTSEDKVTIKFPKVQMKADQQIWSETLNASINNISVKTTKETYTTKSGTQKIRNLTLQSSTPMLSLLYRELKFSSQTIIGLLQIALANGNGNSEPDSAWYDLREYTKQAMLIPALTGLNRESLDKRSLVTMIKINDYLIPMTRFINYIQAMLLRQAGSLGQQFSGYISLEGFPTRSKFLAMNEWVDPQTNNWFSAKRRSYMAEVSGMNLLQSAKIRMRLRNLNLSTLIKSAI